MSEPLIEHRPTIGGWRTRALELEGDGPPLVLLHGFADSADTWRLVLDRLGRARRRAIAVDLPGFGHAGRLRAGRILPQYDGFGRALVDRVARESGRPAILVGNSLGGVVALRVGERADAPLRRIVPIAPAGLDMPRWFALIERDPVVRTLLALPVPVPAPIVRQAVAQVYRRLAFHAAQEPGRLASAFASHYPTRTRVAAMLALGRRVLPELAHEPMDLERVEHEVVVIWGTRDRMVAHSGARILAGRLARVRVELLDGVGHCPQLEVPERVLELILGRVEPPVAVG